MEAGLAIWGWGVRTEEAKIFYPYGISQITPTNSLPNGEARVVWCSTPIPCGELMGAISLLFKPGTLSAGSLISPLFSPAFDHTFDHIQLIRATLIFKMQKDL